MSDGWIIVGGQKHVVPGARVKTWRTTGWRYTEENSAVIREHPPRWIVAHWTASERRGDHGARILYYSLAERRPTPLSVEFFIDNDGVVYQFADPLDHVSRDYNGVRCRHASRLNDRSIGIEVSGLGWDNPRREEGTTTRKRPRYRSPELHGGWRPYLYSYLPEQQKAFNHLVMALISAIPTIPRRVELAPYERRPRGYFDEEAGGVCGHLHCASLRVKHPKIDPGPQPLIDCASALGLCGHHEPSGDKE